MMDTRSAERNSVMDGRFKILDYARDAPDSFMKALSFVFLPVGGLTQPLPASMTQPLPASPPDDAAITGEPPGPSITAGAHGKMRVAGQCC